MTDLNNLNVKLHSLVLFHGILKDPLVIKLFNLLHTEDKTLLERVAAYSSFASGLFDEGGSLPQALLRRALDDENSYVLKRAKQEDLSGLQECLDNELLILQELSQLTSRDIKNALGYQGYLPDWDNIPVDFAAAYQNRMDNLWATGYGIFSKAHMFMVQNGKIEPVILPDPVRLFELKGYERERNQIIQNTLSLLKGKPAANALLYGDAGTGKSSTVKAIANEYREQGLRLIEINKKQFGEIPVIARQLFDKPLKFILFIDDLSFDQNNDEFKALKAILEGSASVKAPNLAVYATSNRRHLVKESFSERNGDDIHLNETIQELTSLSERFGLQVHFASPDKTLYLQIIHGLAGQMGIQMNAADLDLEAERYALSRGGRSPRVARQFVGYLKSIQE